MARKKPPKHLPLPSGPYIPGCVDVMTEYTNDGLFARIFYPSSLTNNEEHSSRWPPWVPHPHYIIGFAYVLSLWTFLIKLLMKFFSGNIKIPAVTNASPNKNIGKLKVAVMSHGLGGTRFFYTSICTELASYGYVIIALEHRDMSSSMTYFYESESNVVNDVRTWLKFKRVKVGSPSHFPERKRQVELRSDECKRALSLLENLNSGETIGNILKSDFDFAQFKDLLDFSKPIMMGHSFGGATALLTLGTDSRFKVGVILDAWMFSIKSHCDLPEAITQPLIFINTQTFHIPPNLKLLAEFTARENREVFTIKHTTHEYQSDTVYIIGSWLNIFMRKIDKNLATSINNKLIMKFLDKHVGFRDSINVEEFLNTHSNYLVEELSIRGVYNKPKKIPNIW